MPPSLSKSTFLMGRQCAKLLWFRYNAKDQIPAPDEASQAVFDQGKEVGELAHQLFPGGIVVAPDIVAPDEVIAATKHALPQRRPLYEPAFAFGGGFLGRCNPVHEPGAQRSSRKLCGTAKTTAEETPVLPFKLWPGAILHCWVIRDQVFVTEQHNQFIEHR